MKILFISNFYPPHHRGGYELLCHEVATNLIARGHRVDVLTSDYRLKHSESSVNGVRRLLHLQSNVNYYTPWQVLRYFPDSWANMRIVKQTLVETKPDVAVIWGMWNLSYAVASAVEACMGSRVAYYLNNAWPIDPSPHEAYWSSSRNSKLGKFLCGALRGPVSLALRNEWLPCPLRLENVAICSRATARQIENGGVDTGRFRVIYHGINVAAYRDAANTRVHRHPGTPLRVVYVGSLLPQKGVHTAIEALGYLARAEPSAEVTLDILGAGHPAYEERLHHLASDLNLNDRITFHSPIARSQLPEFLANFDVLTLPSIWDEPMALISQEAMAAGLVLVGTLTGGTSEILEDEKNGLAFTPGDAEALAAQFQRLASDPRLRERLAIAGQVTASNQFALERTLDELEALFSDAANS